MNILEGIMLKAISKKNAPTEVAEAFGEMGVPTPKIVTETANKISKVERKLTHIAVDHIYGASLMNLRAARDELEKVGKKYDDPRAAEALADVNKLITLTEAVADEMAADVEFLPATQELDLVMEQLKTEYENAALLKLTGNVSKEKMN